MQAHNLTDAEIQRLGYRALVEKLGAVGAARFIRQYGDSDNDYAHLEDKPLDGMSAEEIYKVAVRFETELRKEE